jgi:DNA-binding response OmpR family regulator
VDKVLIVDDDPDLLSGLDQLLSAKYEVYLAASGDEALEVLGDQQIDVVVLDMLMPRLDGQSVLKEIRAQASPPAVIVVSARPDLLASSMRMGANDFLGKPFSVRRLEEKIERFLDRSGEARSLKQQTP